MREIDLIPRDHVENRRVRRWLVRWAWLMALLLLATAAGRGTIAWRVARERPVVEHNKAAAKAAAQRREQLKALGEREADVTSRLAALRRLQDASDWERALGHVDVAHTPRVWLDRLAFRRSPVDPAAADPATGKGRDAGRASVELQHAIEVTGHAVDHAAVTDYMRRLADQPGVHGVRLQNTGLRRYSTADVVDFSLSARLDTPLRGQP